VVSARALGFAGSNWHRGIAAADVPFLTCGFPESKAREEQSNGLRWTLFEASVNVTLSSSRAVPGSMFSYSLVWLPQMVSGLFAVQAHHKRCWKKVTDSRKSAHGGKMRLHDKQGWESPHQKFLTTVAVFTTVVLVKAVDFGITPDHWRGTMLQTPDGEKPKPFGAPGQEKTPEGRGKP